MKAGRYHELLSKIYTNTSADERIKKRLQDYQSNVDNIQKNRLDTKADKVSYLYGRRRVPSLRIMPKVSILRQALPSLAFLILLIFSIYGLVMGLYKDNKNINSDLTASPKTVSKTGESLTDELPDTVEANDSGSTDSSVSETADDGNADPTDTSAADTSEDDTSAADTSEDDASAADISEDDTSAADTSEASDTSSGSDGETDNGSTDKPDDIHYVVTTNNAEALNIGTDYYKNDTYSEDLKIYLNYNDASKVESLFIQSLGSVKKTDYTVEGNIITIKKEYLDTLPDGIYDLNINMDKGNPAIVRFIVHPKEEESEYGFYRLSSYYWDFYLSDPKDFTFLVYNRKDARITGLRNGSIEIDPEYYELDENGYVATLYQNYMADMEEGIRFNLTVEFSDGMEKAIGIKIRDKEVNPPVINSPYNIFEKSKPEDVAIKITWNDAMYITSIDPETHFSVGLSSNDYTLENDVFTIKKEFLESLDAGEYIWYLMYDTETGSDIRIRVND